MLRFDNLSKRYGDRVLFEGLHFDASSGCIALNDESGSGKSTLLAILAGALEADSGEVWLGGHSLRAAPQAARALLTYVPEDSMSWPGQTGRDYLREIASARHTVLTDDVLALAERFGLAPHLDKRFEQMSYGRPCAIFHGTAHVIRTARNTLHISAYRSPNPSSNHARHKVQNGLHHS